MARAGTVLFYLGGAVWLIYALAKYMLGWNVFLRQFLPYHLGAVISGVILKRGSGLIIAALNMPRSKYCFPPQPENTALTSKKNGDQKLVP